MPSCCLTICVNNAKKGAQMFRIPANVKRRKVWISLMTPYLSWSYKNLDNARICEAHFSDNQFIKLPGEKVSRKLSISAIPDLLQTEENRIDIDRRETNMPECEVIINEVERVIEVERVNEDVKENKTIDAENAKYLPTENSYVIAINDYEEKIKTVKRKLQASQKKLSLLQAKYNAFKENLNNIFLEDQLTFIENYGCLKGISWTNKTLHNSIKLFNSCGPKGYSEILRQGLPYPCVRTLQRFKKSGASEEITVKQEVNDMDETSNLKSSIVREDVLEQSKKDSIDGEVSQGSRECGEIDEESQSSSTNKPGRKRHICNICKKTFGFKKFLNRHKLIIHKEKPYSCDQCDKKFSFKGSYIIHKRIHSGEKPYVCDICEKRFIDRSNLTKHRRLHNEYRLYTCDVCNETFTGITNLNHHKLTH